MPTDAGCEGTDAFGRSSVLSPIAANTRTPLVPPDLAWIFVPSASKMEGALMTGEDREMVPLGTGEMAQSVKHLLYKNKGLTSDLQLPPKS